MARNGSGTYSLPGGNPVTAGTPATATWANDTLADVATEITDSLSRSGKGGMTAALAMGNNKITGLATPTLDTDGATKKYVDDSVSAASTVTVTGGTDWTVVGGAAATLVKKAIGVVAGQIRCAAGASSAFSAIATLPAGARPGVKTYFHGHVIDASSAIYYPALFSVDTDGAVAMEKYDDGSAYVAPFVAASPDAVYIPIFFVAA